MEKWVAVTGYEGVYEVSSFGNVRGLPRKIKHFRGGVSVVRGRVLVPNQALSYPQVALCRAGERKMVAVHRLVALHFLDGPKKEEVYHKDGNTKNCRADNLTWVSRAENVAFAVKAGSFRPSINPRMARKLSEQKVSEIRSEFSAGAKKLFLSKKYGVSRAMITAIVNRTSWK